MSTSKSILQESIRIVVPIAILAVGVGGFLAFGRKPDIPQRDKGDDGVAQVRTAKAKQFDGKIVFQEDGVAVPYRTLKVPAEVAGRITDKSPNAKSGRYVKKDETLFKIDVTDYRLEKKRLLAQIAQTAQEIAAAKVDIASTRESLGIAKNQLDLRNQDLDRHRRAFKEGSITRAQVEESQLQMLNAKNAWQTLKNQLATQTQKVKTLKAMQKLTVVQIRKANVDVKRTIVKAPANGTVISDAVEKNDYVKRGDILLYINDSSRAEVKCNLRVEVIYWLWMQSGLYAPGTSTDRPRRLQVPQAPVDVIFEFQGIEYIWNGVLSRYEGAGLDEKTRTVPCRVLIKQPDKVKAQWKAKKRKGSPPPPVAPPTLFSGMYVKLRIPVAPPQPLIEIPPAGLQPGGQVWVVRDGKLQILKVDVARADSNRVLIRANGKAGLQAGDRVVTSPLAGIKNGMPAREVNAQ